MRRGFTRGAFTLVEGLIAAALGILVCGSGIYIYMQGNKMFQTTTEHSSIREEALLVLERMNKDLEALMVSDEVIPNAEDPKKGFYLLQPYKLIDPVEQVAVDRRTGEQKKYTVYTGVEFFVYHHTETRPEGPDGFPLPTLIGRLVQYRCEPINGDPKKGFDLKRNGVKVNKIPLSMVMFRKADPIYAKGNIGASPDAVLDVYVLPKGGMWGTMVPDVMARLVDEGHALMRTFHLVGYESQFTALLSLADAKMRYGEDLDDVEKAIHEYAKSEGLLAKVASKTADSPLEYRLSRGRVLLERTLWDQASMGDKEFANAKTEPGDPEQGKIGPSSINLSAGSRSSRLSL